MSKKHLYLAVAVILIAVVAIFFLEIAARRNQYKYTVSITPNDVLSEENLNYKLGHQAQIQKDYKTALSFYQKSRPDAKDLVQESLIDYDIAYMTEMSGNHIGSIPLYKALAANTQYHPIMRALAVQRIAIIHSLYLDRDAVAAETFKDAPYRNMASGGDSALTYRKLYEYAISMYPLSLSEAMSATWYSHELRTTLGGSTTTPIALGYVATTLSRLQHADADIERIKNNPLESYIVPQIYSKSGVVMADLAMVGVVDPSKAEAYFLKALQAEASVGQLPGSLNAYYYASFLSSYFGKERVEDVKNILSVFSAKNSNKIYPEVPAYFNISRTDPDLSEIKTSLKLLSKSDPDFKKYLMSIGWQGADFAVIAKKK